MLALSHLHALRRAEIEAVVPLFPPGAKVLEIGAGTGEQARLLADRGFAVTAIDVPGSNYADARVFPIIDYDSRHLPFPAAHFDVVYSSNVLEHVGDLDALEREIRRVLKPDGRCIHLVPSTAWRLWTSLATVPNAARFFYWACLTTLGLRRDERPFVERVGRAWWRFLGRIWEMVRQPRHGERGNVFTELVQFGRPWWRRHFESNGFRVLDARPAGLFYTGQAILGSALSLKRRAELARHLGSACNLYVLKPLEPGRRRQTARDRAAPT